jgi:O-antigen ligase
MKFSWLLTETREQKLMSWASVGLLIFVSAFLWAPSRDGLQGVYVLAFFLPMAIILLFRKPNFNEYGGWQTVIGLTYAGFSALSALWGEPKDFGFFVLQWCVLATWLCGSCLVFSKRDIDIERYFRWLVVCGVSLTAITFTYHFVFVDSQFPTLIRLVGWNVFRNSNEIGALFGIISLLAITIAVQASSLKRTWLFYLFALIAGVGLVASFSRGALLAFIVMVIITFIVVRPSVKIWLPPVLIMIIALLILLITTNIHTYYINGRGEGFGGRFVIWKEVLNRYHENIFTGIGMAKDTGIIIPGLEIFNHAHNAWLDTLYRTGLIGLTLALLHLKEVLQKFSRDPRLLPLYLWLSYSCLCNLFDGRCFFWEIGAKWFLYWIPASLIVAIHTGISARTLQTGLKEIT